MTQFNVKQKVTGGFFSALILSIIIFCNTVYAEDAGVKSYETLLVGIVEVKDIDVDSRQVTLDAGNGKMKVVTLGEEVRNFERIKKGDVIVIEYYEGLVISLTSKGSVTASVGTVEAMGRAAKGDKPAVKVVEAVQLNAIVEDVDSSSRVVILRGPENLAAFKVDKSVNLANVKKGDTVTISYLEGYAVSVQPPADVVAEMDIKSKSLSFIIGVDWGHGTLKLRKGGTHKLKVSGLSLGGVGYASIEANGYVYNLKDVKDIEGTYRTMRIGLTLAAGGTSMIMKNSKGVKIRMESKEQGARLALGPQGLKIELSE